jgi:hypothetical protein
MPITPSLPRECFRLAESDNEVNHGVLLQHAVRWPVASAAVGRILF